MVIVLTSLILSGLSSEVVFFSGQRQPKEHANYREYNPVHDSLGRLPGEMYPLPADAVGAVEVQFHIF